MKLSDSVTWCGDRAYFARLAHLLWSNAMDDQPIEDEVVEVPPEPPKRTPEQRQEEEDELFVLGII